MWVKLYTYDSRDGKLSEIAETVSLQASPPGRWEIKNAAGSTIFAGTEADPPPSYSRNYIYITDGSPVMKAVQFDQDARDLYEKTMNDGNTITFSNTVTKAPPTDYKIKRFDWPIIIAALGVPIVILYALKQHTAASAAAAEVAAAAIGGRRRRRRRLGGTEPTYSVVKQKYVRGGWDKDGCGYAPRWEDVKVMHAGLSYHDMALAILDLRRDNKDKYHRRYIHRAES